jgi:uncharacterized protein YjbJ (UPF0337 family)
MHCHQVIGNWKQVKGVVTDRLDKLTDDDGVVIAEKRDLLTCKIEERHGIACEQAKKNLGNCEASLR